jgi:hypothetical protein
MVDEREDGVERLRHEGRVHRWSRRSPAWPGHTTFVALKGGEAVLGDRYAGEGVERTYACDLRSLLDGCFHSVISEQLGARVLEELLTEARRELGWIGGERPRIRASARKGRFRARRARPDRDRAVGTAVHGLHRRARAGVPVRADRGRMPQREPAAGGGAAGDHASTRAGAAREAAVAALPDRGRGAARAGRGPGDAALGARSRGAARPRARLMTKGVSRRAGFAPTGAITIRPHRHSS